MTDNTIRMATDEEKEQVTELTSLITKAIPDDTEASLLVASLSTMLVTLCKLSDVSEVMVHELINAEFTQVNKAIEKLDLDIDV